MRNLNPICQKKKKKKETLILKTFDCNFCQIYIKKHLLN